MGVRGDEPWLAKKESVDELHAVGWMSNHADLCSEFQCGSERMPQIDE